MEITPEFIENLQAHGDYVLAYCEEKEAKKGSLILTKSESNLKVLRVLSMGEAAELFLEVDDIILVPSFNISLLLKSGSHEWYWLDKKVIIARTWKGHYEEE
jgi:hypothetical protein